MKGPVVVTGAAGYLGTYLTRALAAAGETVHAVDVRPDPNRFRLGTVRYARADIRDIRSIRPLIQGASTVFNLANADSPLAGGAQVRTQVNVEAPARLVRACAAAEVQRFVQVSTVGVYGRLADVPAREGTRPAPSGAYERSRLNGDLAVEEAARAAGLDFIILRLAWLYGPGCRPFAALLRSVRSGRFIYPGDGQNLSHPIFVADAVEALCRARNAPDIACGRPYIVAGPRYVAVRELVEVCARVLGVSPPRWRVPREIPMAIGRVADIFWGVAGREPPFSRRTVAFLCEDNAFDIEAARTKLGFDPQVDLDEGVRRTVQDEVLLLGT